MVRSISTDEPRVIFGVFAVARDRFTTGGRTTETVGAPTFVTWSPSGIVRRVYGVVARDIARRVRGLADCAMWRNMFAGRFGFFGLGLGLGLFLQFRPKHLNIYNS